MESTNNNELNEKDNSVSTETTTVEQQPTLQTNGVADFNKVIFNNRSVTPHILLDHFKEMLTNNKIVFYDKRGNKNEFDNMGISSRRTVKMEDKNGTRNKYVVVMKTYIHLMGDVVVMEWDDDEVSYTTKLNHADLQNWSGKMHWKGTYSQVQSQLQTQAKIQTELQPEVQAETPTQTQTQIQDQE